MFEMMRVGETRRVRRWGVTVVAALALLAAAPASPAAANVKAFDRIDCVPREDVRFCEGQMDLRIRSFDGVPLDVNLALPAVGDTNLPLLIFTHSWGDQKISFSP